jgi:hypothetical protein
MSIAVADGQTKTQRLQVSISLQTQAFLSLLAGKGTHGTSVTDVARNLIEQGIREALEKGHLNESDRTAVQKSVK